MFGVAPTGRYVWWTGILIFTFDGNKVRDLYVLGDIYGLIERMRSAQMPGVQLRQLWVRTRRAAPLERRGIGARRRRRRRGNGGISPASANR